MIVVLDASVVISAALKLASLPAIALRRATDPSNRLIISTEVLAEYQEVLLRAKFDRFVSVEQRLRVLQALRDAASQIDVLNQFRECADPKDDKYLSLAAAGQADVIVSSDDHLLHLHPWRGIAILKPRDFIDRAMTMPG